MVFNCFSYAFDPIVCFTYYVIICSYVKVDISAEEPIRAPTFAFVKRWAFLRGELSPVRRGRPTRVVIPYRTDITAFRFQILVSETALL